MNVEPVKQDQSDQDDSSKPDGDSLTKDLEAEVTPTTPGEHGGPAGLEPTRYGDWERKGRCIDF